MRTRLLGVSVILGCTIFIVACNADAAPKTPIPPAKVDVSLALTPGQQRAVFAGGCFWGTQAVFERVK
ncbi:MAG: peptide-methionine (S)-S-oxide reductase MsrA, partial [Terriglobales bacterium]